MLLPAGLLIIILVISATVLIIIKTRRTTEGKPVVNTEINRLIMKVASIVLAIIWYLGIIYALRRMVASLKDDSPFTRANARRMRWVALLIIGLGVAKWLFTWVYYRMLSSKVVLTGIEAHMDKLNPLTFGMQWDYWTTGILLLLLAEVFRKGVALQD